MVTPPHAPQEFRKTRQKKNRKPLFIILLLTAIIMPVLAACFYFFHMPPGDKQVSPLQIQETQKSADSKEEITTVITDPDAREKQAPIHHLEKQEGIITDKQSGDFTASTDDTSQIISADPVAEKEGNQYKKASLQISSFFKHLEKQQYIQDFQLGEPVQQYFLSLTDKLLNNPPVVSRELDDLHTLHKNIAHFFRVTGARDTIIIRTILEREQDSIEDTAAGLFLLSQATNFDDNPFKSQPATVNALYDYAGFFLNTVGGRSYMFRRDSRTRLLVNYYAVLLIDQANREAINRHGINIKPLLPMLINEIEASGQLIHKERYLDRLYELMEKYQAR